MTKLHLGCGLITPEDWVNIDGSWNARLAKYPTLRRLAVALRILPKGMMDIPWSKDILVHNVKKPLSFKTNSVEAVYSSHLLEHLYYEEAGRLLRECYRVLHSGGILRIVVPDLRAMVLEYLGGKKIGDVFELEDKHPAHRFQERLLLRTPYPPSGPLPYRLYSAMNDFHSHKWMYDAESLCQRFEDTGFLEVREMHCHDSRITGIDSVENPKRILNGAGICVEGMKP